MASVPQRVWARTPPDPLTGVQQWVQVVADPQTGLPDLMYFAALAQCLRLNFGESPMFGGSGIPARQSVDLQIPPDLFIARIQTQYSGFFASLVISKGTPTVMNKRPVPVYNAYAVTHAGLVLTAAIPTAT